MNKREKYLALPTKTWFFFPSLEICKKNLHQAVDDVSLLFLAHF